MAISKNILILLGISLTVSRQSFSFLNFRSEPVSSHHESSQILK